MSFILIIPIALRMFEVDGNKWIFYGLVVISII